MSEETTVPTEDENQSVEETAVEQTEETTEGSAPEEGSKGEEAGSEEVAVEAEANDDTDSEPTQRPVYTMPVSKAQEEKKRAVAKAKEEAAAEMAKLREKHEADLVEAKKSGTDTSKFDDELAKVAEKHGLQADAARDLAEAIKGSINLPDMSKYDEIVKQKEVEGHKLAVSREFDEIVLPIIKKDFPNATPEHIAEVKDRVSELAFSKGYNTYRLQDIYRVKQGEFKFKTGFTAETAGGHSNELVDFSSMTDAEEHELAKSNPGKYKQYLDYMSGKGSRFID